jgi:hypothetical protein
VFSPVNPKTTPIAADPKDFLGPAATVAPGFLTYPCGRAPARPAPAATAAATTTTAKGTTTTAKATTTTAKATTTTAKATTTAPKSPPTSTKG